MSQRSHSCCHHSPHQTHPMPVYTEASMRYVTIKRQKNYLFSIVNISNDCVEFPFLYGVKLERIKALTSFKLFLSIIFGFACKKEITFYIPCQQKSKELVYPSPLSGCVCMNPPPTTLAQVDLSTKHGDEQNDAEAAEDPQVLEQEEDQLGGVGLLLGYALHLWELRGGVDFVISC